MTKQDVTVELYYDATWHDATFAEEVYSRDPITISRGRTDEVGVTTPSTGSLTMANARRRGKWNPAVPRSPLYGKGRNVPARISVAGDVRLYADGAAWSPGRTLDYDESSDIGDAWSSLRLAGILGRRSQGDPPKLSPMRRFVDQNASEVVAYWSCEEGTASQFVSLTAGAGGPFVRYQFSGPGTFEPGAGDMAPWAGKGVKMLGTVEITAQCGMASGLTAWAVDWTLKGDQLAGGDPLSLIIRGPASTGVDNWQIDMYPDTALDEIDVFEAGAGSHIETNTNLFVGNAQRHVRFAAAQNGADVDYTLYIDGVAFITDTAAGITLARVSHLDISAGGTQGLAVSDVVVWDTAPAIADTYAAATGYAGELTTDRFSRLCTEEGLTATIVGDATDVPNMGPQHPDDLVGLFREIEATDGGIVYETRSSAGMSMRTGRSLYNQDAVLTLDWDAQHVAPPLDPTIDDLPTRNDVTAATRSGGTARAVQESGPLNVAEPVDDEQGVGRKPARVDVNVMSDLELPAVAYWHLHLGTVDEPRWKRVTVDLVAAPDVDVSGVELGDRLTIVNAPADVSPDTISLIIMGWTETIGPHTRTITFFTVPESPYHVTEVGHADYMFIGSDGSSVGATFVAGVDTSLSVTVAAGRPLWSYEATFDINVAGVRLRVTGISGASSPQTFTVNRDPVNGVRKTLAVGDKVDLFYPSYIGR